MWRPLPAGWEFVEAVTAPQALAALQLTFARLVLVVAINAVMGTLIAWVLVRDDFPGKAVVNALIDLPFALPTIVAGLTLLALYGPRSPFGINIAYPQVGIVLALLFVTLPFVVRAVQPVLRELDREMEEAAASLGATRAWTMFRRIVLPNLAARHPGRGRPGLRPRASASSARSCSSRATSRIRTEVASVYIYGQVETDNARRRRAVSVVLLVPRWRSRWSSTCCVAHLAPRGVA